MDENLQCFYCTGVCEDTDCAIARHYVGLKHTDGGEKKLKSVGRGISLLKESLKNDSTTRE